MPRILLIDDDELFRTMLRMTLTHFGHTVIEAKNGLEGLRLLPEANADLLITDIVMPEKEGLGLLRELGQKMPLLKIIAMSGGGTQNKLDYLHVAKLLGANQVLKKPFSTEVFMAAVNQLLSTGNS